MIHPTPAIIKKEKALTTPNCFAVLGDFQTKATELFKAQGVALGDGYSLEISFKRNEKTTYVEELARNTDEKYILTLSENGATLDCSDEKSAFYGVNTFLRLVKQNELFVGEIEDYPLFQKRGYIEGFYGKTWAHEKRLSVMKLMAQNGMNTFYYGPKDDLYHREKWAEPYPEKELDDLKTLFDFAESNYIEFSWCIGPGLSYCYTSEEDFTKLFLKLTQLYEIGIRSFGLLLDDIASDFQYESDNEQYDDIVYAHIDLVNRLYKSLKEKDGNITLTVCPTQYSGDENGFYISTFGQGIPKDVLLFWTGEEICSRVLTSREAKELISATSHKPLFWDNYPVNDCEMFKEMHLDGIQGRDRDLYLYADGLISNVMEYAECSKIPLLTIADYLWNPMAYNKEKSTENAQRLILGDKAETFFYFADHLGVSCLSKYSSAYMSDVLHHFFFLYMKGEKENALHEFSAYLENMNACSKMLADESVSLFCEIKEWSGKFKMACSLLADIKRVMETPTDELKAVLQKNLTAYNNDATLLTGFCLREAAEKALLLKE